MGFFIFPDFCHGGLFPSQSLAGGDAAVSHANMLRGSFSRKGGLSISRLSMDHHDWRHVLHDLHVSRADHIHFCQADVPMANTHPVVGFINPIYHNVGSDYCSLRYSLRFPGTTLYAEKLASHRMVHCAARTKEG